MASVVVCVVACVVGTTVGSVVCTTVVVAVACCAVVVATRSVPAVVVAGCGSRVVVAVARGVEPGFVVIIAEEIGSDVCVVGRVVPVVAPVRVVVNALVPTVTLVALRQAAAEARTTAQTVNVRDEKKHI